MALTCSTAQKTLCHVLLVLLTAWSAGLVAQLADPISQRIPAGNLILDLEDWIEMPPSSNELPRTRLSVFRTLPDGRIFVNDLRGDLHVIENGKVTTYLDLPAQFPKFIDAPGLGTGFHAFAFHPEFAKNGKFYTTHTEPWNANGSPVDFHGPSVPTSAGLQAVLTEWTVADPRAKSFSGTRREVFRVYFNGFQHGVQEITFNPTVSAGDADYGLLYVCVGEGGSFQMGKADDEHRRDSPYGTILRIDPLGHNSANGQYGIPRDNPWAGATEPGVLKEMFAYGFRNPHRINWDPGGTHLFYEGDIGEANIEEINILRPGGDYGYPEREGTFVLRAHDPKNRTKIYELPPDDKKFGYIYPVVQFDHDEGRAMVIGPVYRGQRFPQLNGTLFFGSIDNGRIFFLNVGDLKPGLQVPFHEVRLTLGGVEGSLASFVGNSRADLRFGVDQAGEIYIITRTDGKIKRVVGVRQDPVAVERK